MEARREKLWQDQGRVASLKAKMNEGIAESEVSCAAMTSTWTNWLSLGYITQAPVLVENAKTIALVNEYNNALRAVMAEEDTMLPLMLRLEEITNIYEDKIYNFHLKIWHIFNNFQQENLSATEQLQYPHLRRTYKFNRSKLNLDLFRNQPLNQPSTTYKDKDKGKEKVVESVTSLDDGLTNHITVPPLTAATVEAKLVAAEQKIITHETAITALENAILLKKSRIYTLQTTVEELQQASKTNQALINDHDATIKRLEAELKLEQAEVKKLRAANAGLETTMIDQRRDYGRQVDEVQRLQQENATLTTQYEAAKRKIKNLKTTNQELKTEKQNLTAANQNLTTGKKELVMANQELTAKNESNSKEIESLKASLAEDYNPKDITTPLAIVSKQMLFSSPAANNDAKQAQDVDTANMSATLNQKI